MRRAFVGLSTPIGFDYENTATKTQSDHSSSPNPILDSPFGILLLFDEIIFLSRSLCPENMRSLPYVKFLDEQGLVPDISSIDFNGVGTKFQEHWDALRNRGDHDKIVPFSEAIRNAGVTWRMGVDNHSHTLNIGPFMKVANADISNLVFDIAICEQLSYENIELVTNSRLQPILEVNEAQWADMRLTELLVLDDIPNYLTPKGPYHQVIEEVRENAYLKDFRKWIVQQDKAPSESELKEIEESVSASLKEYLLIPPPVGAHVA